MKPQPGGLRGWLDPFLQAPQFLSRYPYYAAVLARVEPVADPSVHHMAVSLYDQRFYLHINVDYFVQHPQHLTGLLLHEVHHIVLGHLGHPRYRQAAAPELMQLALEMSANEFIEEPLPDPIEWQTFQRFGMRAGQSTLQRYHKLLQVQPRSQLKDGDSTVDDHGPWRDAPNPGGLEQTRQLLCAAVDEVAAHGAPPEDRGVGVQKRHLLAGREPGRLIEALTGSLRPPETALDWRRALMLFAACTRTAIPTYARPSRRFPDRVGQVPGRTYAPRTVTRPALLVALDTSLSMTAPELAEVARHLALLQRGARLIIAECDTQVQRLYGFSGALEEVAGRGGTDLRPVFAPDVLGQVRPDGVIYFTDGQGPFPSDPPALPVLWVLTKPDEFLCPWGTRAQLNRSGAPAPATGARRRRKQTG